MKGSTPSVPGNWVWQALRMTFPYLFTVILFVVVALALVERGMLNADEGFYALASKLVTDGHVPYRDFAYTQAPLFPYLQGAVMAVVGFGVREQRWLNVFWDACVLGLIAWRLRRASLSPLGVCGLLTLWVAALPLFYYCVVGKSYALTQCLLVLSATGLWWKRPRVALVWVAFWGVLAVGCRLTSAPAVAVLYIGVAWRVSREDVGWTAIVLVPTLLAAGLLMPFFLCAPENMYFWMWDYHSYSMVPRRPWVIIAGEVVLMAPGLFALAGWAFWRSRTQWGRFSFSPSALCLWAGMVGVVVNIVVPATYAEYSVLFGLLVLLGAGGVLAETGGFLKQRRPALGFVLLSAATTIASGIFARSYDLPGYLDDVGGAAAFVATHTPATAYVLSPRPEIALKAGRCQHSKLVLGNFGVTGEMSEERAGQLNILHITQLVAIIEAGEAGAIVLTNPPAWNFERSVPSLLRFSKEWDGRTKAAIAARYSLAYRNTHFSVLLPKRVSKP